MSLPVNVKSSTEYREIGIRSHGKGIFHKAPISGDQLGDKRVFWVVPNALVLNIVFAWEQAVAVTTSDEEGMIASHRFPMYKPIAGKSDVHFLLQFFKTKRGKHLLELASPGGAGRNKTLGQREFERLEVKLPAADEQGKIAAILGTWDDAVELASRLVANSKRQKRAILRQLLPYAHKHEITPSGWTTIRLGDVATINRGPRPSRPPNGRVTFLPMDAVSENGEIIRRDERDYDDVCSGYTAFRNGDVLVAKITPCFENGKGAFVDGLTNNIGFGSTEFHVVRPNADMPAGLVAHIVGSAEFRLRGAQEMEGSAGQKRVSADFIRSFKFACPTAPDEQRRIVSMLDTADALVRHHAAIAEALSRERESIARQLLTGKRRVRLPAAVETAA